MVVVQKVRLDMNLEFSIYFLLFIDGLRSVYIPIQLLSRVAVSSLQGGFIFNTDCPENVHSVSFINDAF